MTTTATKTLRECLPAQELLSTVSPRGMEVFQVTTDPDFHTHVFYNYAEAFDPNACFILLARNAADAAKHPEAVSKVLFCDLRNRFELTEVNAEPSYDAASVSIDGRHVVYVLVGEEEVTIRRWSVADHEVETVGTLPCARPAFNGRRIRSGKCWAGFSHDGLRFHVTTTFEGADKYNSVATFVFDTESWALSSSFEAGPRAWNFKTQFAPCFGPQGEYLLTVSDSFSKSYFDAEGRWRCDHVDDHEPGGCLYLADELGVIRYAYPVGRDRPHQNASHHAWFGKSAAQAFHVDATDTADHWRGTIMLAEPVAVTDQTRALGRRIPGGRQIEMTRRITRPDVCHICITPDAQAMVCDTIGYHEGIEAYLYVSRITKEADGPVIEPRYLLHPKSSWKPYWCECIPCLAPDKQWVLFNSDYPGVRGYQGQRGTPQVFAVRGFEL